MPDRMTWKGLFLIWMLALPMLGWVGYSVKQYQPETYARAESATMQGIQLAQATWKKVVAEQKAEEPKKEAAAQTADVVY